MRRVHVIIVLFTVGIGVGTAVGPSLAAAEAVPSARLTVEEVSVSPSTPAVGSPVTVTATVQNSDGSTSPVSVDRVALRRDHRPVAEAEQVGALSSGDDLTVPLTATFDSPGTKSLEIVVTGTDSDGDNVRVVRPVTVVVEDAAPSVTLDLDRAIAGIGMNASVTVANPTRGPLRDVVARITGDWMTQDRPKAVEPLLESGAVTRLALPTTPRAAGDRTLTATVDYTTATGTRRSVTVNRSLTVEPLVEDVGVTVSPVPDPGSGGDTASSLDSLIGSGEDESDGDPSGSERDLVRIAVANFGNAPIEAVEAIPRADGRRLARASVADRLGAGEQAVTRLDLSLQTLQSNVTVGVDYTVGARNGSVEKTISYRPNRGRIALTGINVTRRADDSVMITGNVGNTGGGPIGGLVLGVGESESARAADRMHRYFVGTLEPGQFVPFEVRAEITGENRTVVPINASYSVNGLDLDRTIPLAFDDGVPGNGSGGEGGGGLGLVLVGVIVLALSVIGIYVNY